MIRIVDGNNSNLNTTTGIMKRMAGLILRYREGVYFFSSVSNNIPNCLNADMLAKSPSMETDARNSKMCLAEWPL